MSDQDARNGTARRSAASLRRDCAEAYQAVIEMAHAVGWWDKPDHHPWHAPIEKLLDNLSAAADDKRRPHNDLLPFHLPELVNHD